MKRLGVIILFVVVLVSCESKFPDYIEKETGIYQQLISFDEGDESYKQNRYVKASVKLYNKDSLIFKHYKEEVLHPNKHQFKFLFNYLNKGDSASFMIDSKLLIKQMPLLKNIKLNTDYVRAEVKVYDYFTDGKLIEDAEMNEQILFKKYLEEHKEFIYKNGIYIKQLNKGKGEGIQQGDDIRIHYKANFINRIEFDNTYKTKDFRFRYGTPGQVIKGISMALRGMKTGEKVKIIIPSQLAFGEEGSSTQVVPPYTTVIYELEIVNVN